MIVTCNAVICKVVLYIFSKVYKYARSPPKKQSKKQQKKETKTIHYGGFKMEIIKILESYLNISN